MKTYQFIIALLIFLKISLFNCDISPFFNEEGDYGLLGCKISSENKTKIPKFCQICRPDRRCFTITENKKFANYRYTSIGTNLTDLQCQIEIKLPLEKEEKGIWSCHFDSLEGTSVIIENTELDYVKSIERYTRVDNKTDLQLKCYSPVTRFTSCHFFSPQGELHEGIPNMATTGSTGDCSLNINHVKDEHLGEWSCVIEAVESFVIKINIKKINAFYSYYNDVEVDKGSNIKLLCKSGLPLAYCRFINPAGTSFHLKTGKSGKGIEYFGKGIKAGECGLTIKEAKEEHIGIWKCAAMPLYYEKVSPTDYNSEIFADINVMVDTSKPDSGPSNASAIGAGVGVGIAVLLLVGFFIFKRRQKRRTGINVRRGAMGNDHDMVTFGTL